MWETQQLHVPYLPSNAQCYFNQSQPAHGPSNLITKPFQTFVKLNILWFPISRAFLVTLSFLLRTSPPQKEPSSVGRVVYFSICLSRRAPLGVYHNANPLSDPLVPEVTGPGPGASDAQLFWHRGRVGQLLCEATVAGPGLGDDLQPDAERHTREPQTNTWCYRRGISGS